MLTFARVVGGATAASAPGGASMTPGATRRRWTRSATRCSVSRRSACIRRWSWARSACWPRSVGLSVAPRQPGEAALQDRLADAARIRGLAAVTANTHDEADVDFRPALARIAASVE